MESNETSKDYAQALPESVLAQIFENCSLKDRTTLKHVTPSWSSIVDKYFGKTVVIGFGDTYGLQVRDSLGKLELLVLFCYSRKHRRDLDILNYSPEADAEVGYEPNQNVRIELEQSQTLYLIGNFSPKALLEIMSSCKNVSTMYLHASVFETLRVSEETEIPVELPSLKHLHIDATGIAQWMEHRTENRFDFQSCLTGLIAFLKSNHFPALHTLLATIPFYKPMEYRVVGAMSAFMDRHKDTLKAFSYHQRYRVSYSSDDDASDSESGSDTEFLTNEPEQTVDSKEVPTDGAQDTDAKQLETEEGKAETEIPDNSELESATDEQLLEHKDKPTEEEQEQVRKPKKISNFQPKYQNSGIISYDKQQEKVIDTNYYTYGRKNPNHWSQRPTRAQRVVTLFHQIKSLQLEELHVAVRSRRIQDTNPLWFNFMIQQRQLKTILYKGFFCPLPINMFKRNAATLTTVYMDIIEVGVTLSNFSSCEHLKTLILVTKYHSSAYIKEQEVADVCQAECLPKSLETVKFKNLLTSTVDADFICLKLPKLKNLSFQKIGTHLDMGLSIQAFKDMWFRKTVTSFEFSQSLNFPSFACSSSRNSNMCDEINLIGFLLQHLNEDFSHAYIAGKLNSNGQYVMTSDKECRDELQIDPFSVTESKLICCEEESDEEYITDESVCDSESESEEEASSAVRSKVTSGDDEDGVNSNDSYETVDESDEDESEPLQDDVLNKLLQEYKSSYENMIWNFKKASGAGGDDENSESNNNAESIYATPSGDQ